MVASLPFSAPGKDDGEIETLLTKTSSVLLAAKVSREHLKANLKTVNASKQFQAFG